MNRNEIEHNVQKGIDLVEKTFALSYSSSVTLEGASSSIYKAYRDLVEPDYYTIRLTKFFIEVVCISNNANDFFENGDDIYLYEELKKLVVGKKYTLSWARPHDGWIIECDCAMPLRFFRLLSEVREEKLIQLLDEYK